jgi:intracellular multiplication protein IcmD
MLNGFGCESDHHLGILVKQVVRESKTLLSRFRRYGAFAVLCCFFYSQSYADTTMTIGSVASQIILSFENLSKLITASSYIAGLGFSMGAILKFKQHKDNPTQIPIGTPIAMLFVASALLFFPSLLDTTGKTIFGASNYTTAGWSGMVFS